MLYYYRQHRLKTRLKNTYPQLVFHKSGKLNIIVFSEDLSMGDIAEESMTIQSNTESDSEEDDMEIPTPGSQNKQEANDEEAQLRTLFHAAMMSNVKLKIVQSFTKIGLLNNLN